MRRMTFLVYQLPQGWEPRRDPCSSVKWILADAENTSWLFSADKRRKEKFLNFLREGFLGVYLYRCDSWVTYGWMSRPSTGGPRHLPASIRLLNTYWIFHCRTQDSFRGLGYYKLVLRLLAQQALKEDEDASTYVDTNASNVASRRAILSVGFRPKGVMTGYRLQVPKVSLYVWWWWDAEAAHPRLLGS
jgi:RimJ/RimL family protein N-acetyltransferase